MKVVSEETVTPSSSKLVDDYDLRKEVDGKIQEYKSYLAWHHINRSKHLTNPKRLAKTKDNKEWEEQESEFHQQ